MALIGSFYIMTTFLGFGAATIVGRDFIGSHGGTNMSAPLLAQALAGDIFFAFICAIAFATILAVVAGLTISASTSFAHDFWTNVIHAESSGSQAKKCAWRASPRLWWERSRWRSDFARTNGQRGLSSSAGVCCGGVGEFAGDRVAQSSGSVLTPPAQWPDWE